ncbi:MAG: pentapeptide repeat-containing protein [Silvibacterium sp.]
MRRLYEPPRPLPWPERRTAFHKAWALPFVKFEWYLEWIAWALGNWALLEVLEYLGTFTVLVAVIFYFAESGDRTRQRHYAAWAVINSAQGKGGSGGRIEALQELNRDRVPLIGLDGSMAFLQGVQLSNAMLSRCSFQDADLRQSVFRSADLTFCNLRSANFRNADFDHAKLADIDLTEADLTAANLSSAELARADLSYADLRNANLSNIRWKEISSMHLANLFGVSNAPDGFLQFALSHGAVAAPSDEEWTKLQNAAKHGHVDSESPAK